MGTVLRAEEAAVQMARLIRRCPLTHVEPPLTCVPNGGTIPDQMTAAAAAAAAVAAAVAAAEASAAAAAAAAAAAGALCRCTVGHSRTVRVSGSMTDAARVPAGHQHGPRTCHGRLAVVTLTWCKW